MILSSFNGDTVCIIIALCSTNQ